MAGSLHRPSWKPEGSRDLPAIRFYERVDCSELVAKLVVQYNDVSEYASGRAPISVVIPVRNRPALVLEAIDSVLAQSLLPQEIIVVDDASTQQVDLSNYLGSSVTVKVLRGSRRRGAQLSRLAGVKAAKSDLVAFLDSDDLWLPNWISSQLFACTSFSGSWTWVASAGFLISSNCGDITEITPRQSFDGTFLSAGEKPCTLGFSSILAPRDLILKSRALHIPVPAYQEWYSILRMARFRDGVINHEHLFYWRPGEDSISRRKRTADISRWLISMSFRLSTKYIGGKFARFLSLIRKWSN